LLKYLVKLTTKSRPVTKSLVFFIFIYFEFYIDIFTDNGVKTLRSFDPTNIFQADDGVEVNA
jgi:hypothetical protein